MYLNHLQHSEHRDKKFISQNIDLLHFIKYKNTNINKVVNKHKRRPKVQSSNFLLREQRCLS